MSVDCSRDTFVKVRDACVSTENKGLSIWASGNAQADDVNFAFFFVGSQLNWYLATTMGAMPSLGCLLCEFGGRIRNNEVSENAISVGVFLLSIWVVAFLVPGIVVSGIMLLFP